MDDLRSRAPRWIIAGFGLLLAWAAHAAPAAADTSSFDVGDQAVVTIQMRGKNNDLTVRSWDRPTIQIDSADSSPVVARRTVVFGTEKQPLTRAIPPMAYVQREGGAVVGTGMLPPEDFPYAGFRPGPHDVVRVNADEGTHLVVTVPASTGILATTVVGGQTSIEGYHGANLLAVQVQGQLHLIGVTTTAFLQMSSGSLDATDATFERVRLRANAARVVFERCRSRQIEATSVSGSIVYDDGTFDAGLARFESQSGSIALGAAAPAQLAGRSQEGHVYTQFDRGNTPVAQTSDGNATATIGGGGPLVNALTARGNIYLYDGSLQNRRTGPEWRPIHQLLSPYRRVARPIGLRGRPAIIRTFATARRRV